MKVKKAPSKKEVSERALGFWGVAAIIWTLYKYYFHNSFFISEIFLKPLVFIGATLVFIFFSERNNLLESLGLKTKAKSLIYWLLLFFFSAIFFVFVKQTSVHISFLGNLLFINLLTALSEDILTFSLILRTQIQDKKHPLFAAITTSSLYTLLRVPSLFFLPNIHGSLFLNILFLSFLLILSLSIVYIRKRSLYPVIFLHFLYLNITTLFAF